MGYIATKEKTLFFKLFLLFTFIPAMEIYLFILIGSRIGAMNTLVVIILTGVLGAYLARTQGLKVIYDIQKSMAQGIMPKKEIISGLMILVGGIVLLTPGFLTDAIGFLLLIPFTREIAIRFLVNYFKNKIDRGNFHIHVNGP